jgi:hypothetical protein
MGQQVAPSMLEGACLLPERIGSFGLGEHLAVCAYGD